MFKKWNLFPKSAPVSSGPPDWLIVGLGNPGAKYDGTRHNIGFAALDILAGSMGVSPDRLKFKSLCAQGTLGGQKVLLMKPSTFMNLSGQAVCEAAAFYKLPMERVLVLCDDVNLPVGKLRIRVKGSDGGHNGLKNIIAHLGHDQFIRIKMGVGEKPKGWDLADHVLGRFSTEDRKLVDEAIEKAAKAVDIMISQGADAAMNEYNRKVPVQK